MFTFSLYIFRYSFDYLGWIVPLPNYLFLTNSVWRFRLVTSVEASRIWLWVIRSRFCVQKMSRRWRRIEMESKNLLKLYFEQREKVWGNWELKLWPSDPLLPCNKLKKVSVKSKLVVYLNWWFMGKGVDSPKRRLGGMTHCEVSWPCPGHWRMSGLLRYRGVPKHSQHQLRTRGV